MIKIVRGALALAALGAITMLANPVAAEEGDNMYWPYTETFSGDGTYYGETTDGHCAIRAPIPDVYDGMMPMALNAEQYSDSLMCGACVEGRGTGGGSGHTPIGRFRGYITDECPECKWGDLDFATSGDGRWDIEWKFVPCPGLGEPTFMFEGSNPWYWKIQARGTISPVDELFVNSKLAKKTVDNFFIMTEDVPFYGEQRVETKTILGGYKKTMVTL